MDINAQGIFAMSFTAARSALQASCFDAHSYVSKHAKKHSRTFIWQADKGLKTSIFGTPPEQASNAEFTAD